MTAESPTTASDVTYNLVSVLYHALQGAETYERYIADAERAGDDELAGFFREVQEEDNRRADRAKRLVAARVAQD